MVNSSRAIKVAGVLGAGVMGSAIAAHLAGAGIKVELLDVVPTGVEGNKSALAEAGLKRALESKPAAFFDPDAARLVRPGNLEEHLERLRHCDLVIEAVTENLDVKRRLFEKVAPFIGEHTLLASNTSGLSVKQMSDSLPAALRSRFLVVHFFNPVRYMRLLELVPAPETTPEVLQSAQTLGERLGKVVVHGKDTTNFIGNRIGIYNLLLSAHEMLKAGLNLETVDAICGKPLGRPKSAVFGTADLVGLDTMLHVAKNCYDSLTEDPERSVFQAPEFMQLLVKNGALGRKTGAGFYKKVGEEIQVIDLQTGQYRSQSIPTLAALAGRGDVGTRLRQLFAGTDAASQFAWRVVSKTLAYSAGLVGVIADNLYSIDQAMRSGFNWELGPFELWDAIGVAESAARMKQEGIALPAWLDQMLAKGRTQFYGADNDVFDVKASEVRAVPRPAKALSAAHVKRSNGVIEENKSCSLIDAGDGALLVELHSKMNTLDADIIGLLGKAVERAERDFSAMVIGNDAEHFSAGANLMMIMGAAAAGNWKAVEQIIAGLQNSLQGLKYCAVPVVAATTHYTLGGGAELAMAADAIQADAETYMGLVEVGVGLVPAGCGCARLVERFTAPLADIEGVDLLPYVAQASLQIAMAKTSTSADEAMRLRFLRPGDGVSLNRDFLLFEAKQKALAMAHSGYRTPRPTLLKAAGYDASRTIGLRIWGMVEGRFASPHDALIARKVAHILCGGNVAAGTLLPEQHFLDLEREAFLSLCGEKKTHERVESMLKTGKPLRN